MQFRDLKTQYEKYKTEIDQAIQNVISHTDFISGSEVKRLEQRLADYVGAKHCITCANGTDALFLVLKAWNIGEGDAVFVPNFTFFATAEVVSQVGATPIFVDVDQSTFNINPKHLDHMIKETLKQGKLKPKVIIPVDLFGLLADYKEINKVAKKYSLLILEDAAQSFGAEYKNEKACSYGQAATTSFFPAKPLGCYGDGGAIFTNDDQLALLLRSLIVHGKGLDKYDNIRIGENSRLDTLQAAILNVKLDAFIKHELDDVNQVYQWYNQELSSDVKVPIIPSDYKSCFAQYTIQLENEELRNGMKDYLQQQGIPTMLYYAKTMHQQVAYKHLNVADDEYPVSIKLCQTVLSLPMHPYLKHEEVKVISEHIKTYLKKGKGL